MTASLRIVGPTETGRLAEIGALTALAYLADGLIDQAHPYVPQLKDAGARAKDAVLLAMADGANGEGQIVGTITLVPPGSPFIELGTGDEFELRMLAVSPIERGRGLGASLTQAALDLAVERGATRVVLSTMETMLAAHKLYERLGFTRREDLDWMVVDNPDGSVSKVEPVAGQDDPSCAQPGVRLLGYSWEPGH